MRKILCCLLFLGAVVSYGQDLVITGVTGPMTMDRYNLASLYVSVKNTGIVPIVGAGEAELYLSVDALYDAGDPMLGKVSFSGLAVGETKSIGVYYYQYPGQTLPPGNYTLFVVADPHNKTQETNEANNTFKGPAFTITAPNLDFSFESLALDKYTFTQNEIVSPTVFLQNQGTTNVLDGIETQFYLSKTPVVDATSFELEVFGAKPLGKKWHNDPGNQLVLSLPTVANGTYYILAKVDKYGPETYGRYIETNEDNNWATPQQITITSGDVDLELLKIDSYDYWPSEISPPSFVANVTIRNNGTTGVVGYSLAPHFVFDTPYRAIPQTGFDNYIAAGETKTVSVQIYSPYSEPIPEGKYFLWLTINENKYINETNYTNNRFVSSPVPFYVGPAPTREALVLAMVPSGTYDNTDKNLSFDLTLKNNGTTGFTETFDLSISDASQNVLATSVFSADMSVPGEQKLYKVPVTLTNTLVSGTYYVQLRPRSPNTTAGFAYLPIESIKYKLTGTMQAEDGTPITQGHIFLYEKGDDGAVTFVQQAALADNTFTFLLDDHAHTLYYVPEDESSGYIPTVYGKTIALKETSYFTTTADMNVVFEALTVQPLPLGDGIIAGSVSSAETPEGRGGDVVVPLGGEQQTYGVLLLSTSGQSVGYTVTDEAGHYRFSNLPRDHYQVLVTLPLDQPQMKDPVDVDLTERNKTVNVVLAPQGVSTSIETLLLSQNLAFRELPKSRFGDAPIALEVTSDSGLPYVINSTDATVAEIKDGKIVINGAGQVTIAVTQAANDFFLPASAMQLLTIEKASQSIVFGDLAPKQNGDTDFELSATASSGLTVIFSSDNEAVASIQENKVILHGPGTTNITATQEGNNNYERAPSVTRTLVVNQVVGVEKPLAVFRLYPNPTQGLTNIESQTAIEKIQVCNAVGETESAVTWDGHQLDLEALVPGVYMARIYYESTVQVLKILKQ